MELFYGANNCVGKSEKGATVAYVGLNWETKHALKSQGFRLVDTSDLLAKIAVENRFEFIDYIALLGDKQTDKQRWWATRTASMMNTQTDFFTIICLLLVSKQLIIEKSCTTIIVDDARLFFAIKGNFGVKTEGVLQAKLDYWKKILLGIAGIIPARLKWAIETLQANKIAQIVEKEVSDEANFLFTWAEERCFRTKSKFSEQYLPGLENFSSKKPIVRFLPYFAPASVVKKMAESGEKMIGLGFDSNVWTVVKSLFVLSRIFGRENFKNLNLEKLWISEILRENLSHICRQMHDFHCWQKFSEQARGTLIYPYENQTWEKMMLMAAHSVNSSVKFVGYQHAAIAKLELQMHATTASVRTQPQPDLIVTNSENHRILLEKYYQSVRVAVKNGGALRFATASIVLKKSLKHERKCLGVLLSSLPEQTLELLAMLRNSSAKNFKNNFKIIVKSHPDFPVQAEELPQGAEVFSGSAIELYQESDGIIYCSSTAGQEAYSYGLPVFRYSGQSLDIQSGEDFFTPKVIHSIDEIHDEDLVFHEPKPMFSPVNEELWREILS